MPREASLFDETSGSPLEAYLLLRRDGEIYRLHGLTVRLSRERNGRKSLQLRLKRILWMRSICYATGKWLTAKSVFTTVFGR
jgi:hypothetical protein